MSNDLQNAFVGEIKLFRTEPIGVRLLSYQVSFGDFEFLALGITGKTQNLETILKRRRNRVQHVRSRDKENFGQIVFDVEVVILEHVILLRVKNFQQRRTWIAAKICAQLVDFVKQQNRIDGSGFLHHLNDLAGQSADVSAAMAANLGFITHAAKRQPHKLSSSRARNRLAETGLADSRRTNETENRSLRVLYQLSYGQVFEDAIFDLFQTVVIFVQNFLGLSEVFDLFRLLLPGHAQQPVDIRARDCAFGGHRRHGLQTMQFLKGLLFSLFGHARLFDLFLQLVEFGALVLAAQLFVNRLDLLVEIILFLRLLHLALDARLDGAIELPLF